LDPTKVILNSSNVQTGATFNIDGRGAAAQFLGGPAGFDTVPLGAVGKPADAGGGVRFAGFVTDPTSGTYNDAIQAGDIALLVGNSPLTIAEWNEAGAVRLTSTGVTVTGDLATTGNVSVAGTLMVTGTKSFVHPHPGDPNKEIVFVSLEGPEAGTYCRGTAKLTGGVARIQLPESFRLVTAEEDVTAQVSAVGEGEGLYIESRTRHDLVVRCKKNAACPKQFDWAVNGVRAGYSNHVAIRDRARAVALR
jgi:hypothetical protein